MSSAPSARETAPPPAAPTRESAPVSTLPAPPPTRSDPAEPVLNNFKDVVRLAGQMRDAKLRTELESYVHLVDFAPGKIELRLHDHAPGGLAVRLTQQLKAWTGRQWLVTENKQADGADTLRDARRAEVAAHPMVEKAMSLFPGAEITAIREPEGMTAPQVNGDEDEDEDNMQLNDQRNG